MAKIGSTQWYWHKKNRWFRPWEYARRRCTDTKHREFPRYGGKGILCLLTREEVLKLFERDQGHLLDRPSLDRIDPQGHYSFDNCRFIEWAQNIATSHRNLKNYDRWGARSNRPNPYIDPDWT